MHLHTSILFVSGAGDIAAKHRRRRLDAAGRFEGTAPVPAAEPVHSGSHLDQPRHGQRLADGTP